MMIFFLPTALAAMPTAELGQARYLARTGRPEQALALIVPHLRADPEDLMAQMLYAWVLTNTLREGAQAEALYRRWHVSSPEALAPRLALVNVLSETRWEAGPWCDEAMDLLQPWPTDPNALALTLRLQVTVSETCERPLEGLESALATLAPTDPVLQAWALQQRAQLNGVDKGMVSQLQAAWTAAPYTLSWADFLWDEDLKGPGVRAARKAALQTAQAALAGKDPVALHAVWSWDSENPDMTSLILDAAQRLDTLDPGWEDHSIEGFNWYGIVHSWVLRDGPQELPERPDFYDAQHRPTKALALASLEALAPDVPPSGPVRATYETQRAELLEQLGRKDEAYAARKAAALADPEDGFTVNTWAYEAALQGKDLELALTAMARVLSVVPAWDPRGEDFAPDYPRWREQQLATRASWLDTQAWILYRMGDYPRANTVQREALLLLPEPDPVYHLHMGLILLAQGQNELAFHELTLGYAAGTPGTSEKALDAEARAAVDKLFSSRRWAPDGFDGWAAAQATALMTVHPPGDQLFREEPVPESVGKPFVGLTFTVDGKKKSVSDYEGVVVVDLWATWCGPCIEGMPHLEEVAKQYADKGVTVLAVSIDKEASDVDRFYEGAERPDLTMGWVGPKGMETLGVTAVPTVFVVDKDGIVVAEFSGYGEGDRRLEEVLGAVVN